LEFLKKWQKVRVPKVATLEPGSQLKNYNLHKVQSLEVPLLEMDALSLKYWLAKFTQEVAKPSKERYSPRTIYQISLMHRTKGAVVLPLLS